jgi:hypothetical protein
MDEETEKTPMTIKAVPTETRMKIGALAKREGLTAGEMLTRMADHYEAAAAGNAVIPPGQPEQTGLPSPTVHVSTGELAVLLHAVAAIGTAAGLPPVVAREAYAAARVRLREARGLPGLPVRKPRVRIGQTIDGLPENEDGLT